MSSYKILSKSQQRYKILYFKLSYMTSREVIYDLNDIKFIKYYEF